MASSSHIVASLSAGTRALLEKRVRTTGIEEGRVLEEALRYYLRGTESIPPGAMIPPRIVVTRRSGEQLLRRIKKPRPTPKLRALMRNGD